MKNKRGQFLFLAIIILIIELISVAVIYSQLTYENNPIYKETSVDCEFKQGFVPEEDIKCTVTVYKCNKIQELCLDEEVCE